MIRVKEGVQLDKLRPQLKSLLPPLDVVFHEHGQHLTITCGSEGHQDTDPHFWGFAFDARSHDLPSDVREQVREKMAGICGATFTVLLEDFGGPNEHYHVQLRKTLWPAIVAAERVKQGDTPVSTQV